MRRMKKMGIWPIAEFKNGLIGKGGIIFAKDIPEAIFKKVLKASSKERKKGKRIRVVINHCDNLEGAKKLKELLKGIGAEVSFISEGPDIFVVGGPGTLICGWQPVE
jgi:fatty acid-binding protein DegV